VKSKLIKWIGRKYFEIVNSIAFYPALIAIGFLFLSILMVELDFSDYGKQLKSTWKWASLKDAETARTIIATIGAGILSLAVFSFSMVMILLNQVASNMSNRVLDSMIGNKFHQSVLGFYIGTIVYSLFLLSTIRDIDDGIYVPALSVYLLIAFTIVDIFLFIYFLHYITQSVKYETIIKRIHSKTRAALEKHCMLLKKPSDINPEDTGISVHAETSGLFQGVNAEELLRIAEKENIIISIIKPQATFILQNSPVITFHGKERLSKEVIQQIMLAINIDGNDHIETHYYYGFRQLMEVAIKALSPGINDPGTAILSLRALIDLLIFRMYHHPDPIIRDKNNNIRIIKNERTFENLFSMCILPIWDYAKKDRLVITELYDLLYQLKNQPYGTSSAIDKLLQIVRQGKDQFQD